MSRPFPLGDLLLFDWGSLDPSTTTGPFEANTTLVHSCILYNRTTTPSSPGLNFTLRVSSNDDTFGPSSVDPQCLGYRSRYFVRRYWLTSPEVSTLTITVGSPRDKSVIFHTHPFLWLSKNQRGIRRRCEGFTFQKINYRISVREGGTGTREGWEDGVWVDEIFLSNNLHPGSKRTGISFNFWYRWVGSP